MGRYIIGIDLGTTNCTMAYSHCSEDDKPEIIQFFIPQTIDVNGYGESGSLPSFIYFPLDEEKEKDEPFWIGTYARERGSEVPNRVVHSAKSWLSHAGIDRRNKFLPEFNKQLSPVEAIKELLVYLKQAWNSKMTDNPFCEQKVIITTPASFDPSARQLVQEAATEAGYPESILLEEPQAAFYHWLYLNQESWRKELNVDDTVLVVDIGGGTTDFSLIAVKEEEGNLILKRESVGSHLLLGGDNIDSTLAYFAMLKFANEGIELDSWQRAQLTHAARTMKEHILIDNPPDTYTITIAGRGSSLIGGQIQTTLSTDELINATLEGFIPLTPPEEKAAFKPTSGLQELGLPYAEDPRISCQLAKFLSMTGEIDSDSMERFVMPSAVLFNGGTVKSPSIQNRLVTLLNSWAKSLKKQKVKVLNGSDYDYAVSLGACYYGSVREGKGIRIKSGTSRSYFVGVEEAVPAIPGIPKPLKAICIVPFGMEEGSQETLDNQTFSLRLGEDASFRFFSHSTAQLSDGTEPQIGTLVSKWKDELSELPSIEANLKKDDEDGMVVHVKLKSKVTELGVLELWCESSDNRKWKLEFDIREVQEATAL